jgi:hypothetical protein
VPQTNETNSEMTNDVGTLRRQRRLFRRLTEEERAARFKRIIEMLQFLMEAWSTFSPLIVSKASDLKWKLHVELGDVLESLPSENTLVDLPEEEELV